jgi:predicted PurR-regulated permease PerM
MNPLPPSGPAGNSPVTQWALAILAGTACLALLYLGRPILVPITLAVVLSFALAPLVRVMRRIGLGHVSSVLVTVSATGLVVAFLALVMGAQVLQMASSLSQYEATINHKVRELRRITIAGLEPLRGVADRMLDVSIDDGEESQASAAEHIQPPLRANVIPVEIRSPPPGPGVLMEQLFARIWGPIETAAIVIVVMIFVLLEQEALRDRFIRLAGGDDLRTTTTAINDAGDRLSRFLVWQFAVNFSVGIVISAVLMAIGLPHAPLWGALTALLRFVPYLGVPIAAIVPALLALAVDPGWSMMLTTLAAFAVVETLAAQVLEPRLYGHVTGLSPLAIVLATVFWGWLWGPIGVIMATPLTLCLAVAGRHAESFGFFDIVLGDGPALTMPQKFYQRAISGDSSEIIAAAREFLKRKPFAAYCDMVLMPALQLARADLATRSITPNQQLEVRGAVDRVVEALGSDVNRRIKQPRKTVLNLPRVDLLNAFIERLPTRLPPVLDTRVRPTVLCVGLGGLGDDLATKLLVRILGDLQVEAREMRVAELQALDAATMAERAVCAVCLISIGPSPEREAGLVLAAKLRAAVPDAYIIAVLLPGWMERSEEPVLAEGVDQHARSFQDAALEVSDRVALCRPKATDVVEA